MAMPRTVLVADDSPLVRVTLSRRFKQAGLTVIEAESVRAASAIDGASLDLAVLDFDLGDGYGDEIAAHLRENNATLPIAFFTSSEDGTERTVDYGPIFAKPAQAEDVVAWVLSRSTDP